MGRQLRNPRAGSLSPFTGFAFLQSPAIPWGGIPEQRGLGPPSPGPKVFPTPVRILAPPPAPCPGPRGSPSLGILMWLWRTSPQKTWVLQGHREQVTGSKPAWGQSWVYGPSVKTQPPGQGLSGCRRSRTTFSPWIYLLRMVCPKVMPSKDQTIALASFFIQTVHCICPDKEAGLGKFHFWYRRWQELTVSRWRHLRK